MKKRIDVIASEEAFNNLSTFTEIEELNESVRTYRDLIKSSVKRSDVQTRLINLLELLKRHSCKQIGVSYMCKNTIADKLEVSYKTVQRLVNKLVDLGIVKQVEMKRQKDMRQTANAILIIPVEKEEVSDKLPIKMADKCPTNKTNSSSLKQKIKDLNKRKDIPPTPQVEDFLKNANYVAHWVPAAFKELATSYYSEAKTIEELWKVIKQCNKVVDHLSGERAFTTEQEVVIGTTALKEFVMKVKSGKPIKNIFGYFNGVVNNLMDKLYFDVDFMNEL